MKRCPSLLCLAVALSLTAGAHAQAVIASLDSSTLPVNPANGFNGFSFGDFAPPGFISQPPLLVFDVIDDDGNNGVFGGIGVDFVDSVDEGGAENQRTKNFDASLGVWELRLRVHPTNEATSIRTTMIDIDGPEQSTGGGEGGVLFQQGDEHVYEFDLTGVPTDGNFHTLTLPVTTPLFTQGAFGLTAGDGIVNPGLRQIQIQSVFGSTGRLHVDVEYARVVVPEPGSLMLLALGTAAACFRRR